APDFPNDQFLPMTELIESWGGTVPESEKAELKIDEKACTQRRLSAEAKGCLLGAKTFMDMNKCAVPLSPETATFRTRIQGKWRSAAASAGGGGGGGTNVWGQKIGGDRGGSAGAGASSVTNLTVGGSTIELSGAYDDMRGEYGFVYVRHELK